MKLLLVSLAAYLLNSTYYIFGDSSANVMKVSSWLLAAFCLFMIFTVLTCVVGSILVLKRYSATLLSEDMVEIRRGILHKIVMYVLFAILICVYYMYHAATLVVEPLLNLTDRTTEIFNGVHALMCFTTLSLVSIIFHPYFFTYSFQLGQIRPVSICSRIVDRMRTTSRRPPDARPTLL